MIPTTALVDGSSPGAAAASARNSAFPTAEHERIYRIIERMMAKEADARLQGSGELLGVLDGEVPVDRTVALVAPTDERPAVRVRNGRPRWARALAWVMASRTRMAKTAAAAALAVTVSACSGHIAIMHRSRCPGVELASDGALTLVVERRLTSREGELRRGG